MAYPRAVDEYLNLPVSKPKPRYLRVAGTFKTVLEEQVHDECGPITKDVQYLVHYISFEYGSKITQVFVRLRGRWQRVSVSRWTHERLFERVKQINFKRNAAYEDQH